VYRFSYLLTYRTAQAAEQNMTVRVRESVTNTDVRSVCVPYRKVVQQLTRFQLSRGPSATDEYLAFTVGIKRAIYLVRSFGVLLRGPGTVHLLTAPRATLQNSFDKRLKSLYLPNL